MSINFAILGFLSREPLTGYDLKKRFAGSEIFYWSGNNNQIYRALVELHQAGWVEQTIEQPESGPARKLYTLTDQGRAELRRWLLSPPELPQLRHPLLIRLAWADQLEAAELDELLAQYEEELRVKLLMLRQQMRRDPAPAGGLWEIVSARWIAFYEQEWEWVQRLRGEPGEREMK